MEYVVEVAEHGYEVSFPSADVADVARKDGAVVVEFTSGLVEAFPASARWYLRAAVVTEELPS